MIKTLKLPLFSKKKPPTVGDPPKLLLGWQEWCAFPKLHLPAIKAKIDTGAKTSALHAWHIRPFHKHGQLYVHFVLHPLQHNLRITRHCTERVIDQRIITSSSGQRELRYIISTPILLGKGLWEIELSLTNRDTMAFRMLLGRDAVKMQAVVDPGKILCQGKLTKREVRSLYSEPDFFQ